MPDQSGYPTDDELRKLKQWDGIHDPWGLIEFLKSIWHWPDYCISAEFSKKRCLKLYISTGGWSGNESIVSALQSNFFWEIFWVSSQRGGHFEFEIPLDWGKI